MLFTRGDGTKILDLPSSITLDFVGRLRNDIHAQPKYVNGVLGYPHLNHLAAQIQTDKKVVSKCFEILFHINDSKPELLKVINLLRDQTLMLWIDFRVHVMLRYTCVAFKNFIILPKNPRRPLGITNNENFKNSQPYSRIPRLPRLPQ